LVMEWLLKHVQMVNPFCFTHVFSRWSSGNDAWCRGYDLPPPSSKSK
jgi:hypothetical protein